ncbi:hypothetical protein PLICRDRAFT_130186 [Plicaturopsis crispa FD-325 SS-3]|nr:hypothetical protein PLICRDRAFT_130186 [Plicaturopsis crispa FD-325 SS-3]
MAKILGPLIALASLDWLATLSLIFGGCCSNAITLEQLTATHPHSGTLITFLQFLLIALTCLAFNLSFSPYPHLAPRTFPIAPYLLQVALFYAVSLLNNAAFAYAIPMSVHIVFRSAGLGVSMAMGWAIVGKRYTKVQVASAVLVMAGVAVTTLSASSPPKKPLETQMGAYAMGIAILSLALVFAGGLGLVQDRMFAKYRASGGTTRPAWQESMFYLHVLALPLFVTSRHELLAQWRDMQRDSVLVALPATSVQLAIPPPTLLLNALTQLLCASGVHRLTSTGVSAVGVTLVLVVRKAVSVIISAAFLRLGGGGGVEMWVGAGMVGLGTVGYALGGRSRATAVDDRRAKKE